MYITEIIIYIKQKIIAEIILFSSRKSRKKWNANIETIEDMVLDVFTAHDNCNDAKSVIVKMDSF